MVFVSFKLIEDLRKEEGNSSFCFADFQYSHISDQSISRHLKTASIGLLKADWMKQKSPQHPKRIAALVLAYRAKGRLKPVEMELSVYNRNLNWVNDGHHRIRALEFCQAEGFYAELGGDIALINEFKRLCRRYR